MPTFGFGLNQVFIILCAVALYLIGLVVFKRFKVGGYKDFTIVCFLLTGLALFFTSQEGNPAPKTILERTDPPVVEITPRSVIEEENQIQESTRRRIREARKELQAEQIEKDSQEFFNHLWKQEQEQRK